jgi:hypothetical protein
MGGTSGGGGGGAGGVSGGTASPPAGSSGAMAGSSGASAGSSGASAGSSGSAGSGMAFVPGSPTYAAVYQEVFVATGCSGGPFCHGSGSVTGGLDMTNKDMTYTLLIDVPAGSMSLPTTMPVPPNCKDGGKKRVVPGNPDMSLLVEKIEQDKPSCGTVMPPSGKIAPAKIQQVRTWIMNGAKKD